MSHRPRALVVGGSETAALLHLPVLGRLRAEGRLDLVEICDLRAASAAAVRQEFRFERASGDAGAAIRRDDIDLVYLFGGAGMHHALGLAAIGAGKHLFVEKPISPTYAEAAQLADAARQRGVVAVGGHNRRFLAALDKIRAERGNAGWTLAEATFHKPELGHPPPFGAATWLSGNGIHALDALLFMMGGLPEWLCAKAAGARGTAAVFTAMMTWPSGAHAVLLCNNEAGERREEYVFHAPGQIWRVVDPVGLSSPGDGFDAEHEAFLQAVATGQEPRHSIDALALSLFVAELIEAGHQGPVKLPQRKRAPASSRTGKTVLVANAERLRGPLGTMPAEWRLVSLEEVDRTSAPRPDIVAAVVGQGPASLGTRTLDNLPNLKSVGFAGLSLRRFDVDRLLDRGIGLVNASDAHAETVAEFALALAILGRRRAFFSHELMRQGGWGTTSPRTGLTAAAISALRAVAAKAGAEAALRRAISDSRLRRRSSSPPSNSPHDLAGATVGLIGWGANAAAFTTRLLAAGARVAVYSEHASAETIRQSGAVPVSLATALAADVVSLHRGLTPATRHCIGAAELARLMPGAVLINVARGALIDPDALVMRLKRGDIFACLDSFEEEPLPRRHPLRRMRNVFLTSHIAGGSPDMHAAAAREVVGKIDRLLEGGTVATVAPHRLSTMT